MAASTKVAIRYPQILSAIKREAINTIVANSFVLGSSLWTMESAG